MDPNRHPNMQKTRKLMKNANPRYVDEPVKKGQFGLASGCAIYFSRMEIRNWFEYQTTGDSSISFDVPLHFEPASLDETIWADYSFGKLDVLLRRTRGGALGPVNIAYSPILVFIIGGTQSAYELMKIFIPELVMHVTNITNGDDTLG